MLLLEFQVFLLSGLLNTLKLSAVVVLGSTLFAIIFSAGLSSRLSFVRYPVYALVEVMRDLPLMVTVLMIYFVLPKAGISLDPFWSASFSVSFWGGANGAHVIRAGLLAVPNAQRETVQAFGLGGWKGFCLVILPQAMPTILPPYISLVTAWVQASSLGAVVGDAELFRTAQILIEQTTISTGSSPAFLVYGAILVVYFVLCWIISRLGRRLEQVFARPYSTSLVSGPRRAVAENLAPPIVSPSEGRT